MQELSSLFPKTDMTLLAFIVLLPLIGAIVNGLFGKRLGKDAVTLMGLASIAGSFVLSLLCFGMLLGGDGGQATKLAWHGWEWMQLSGTNGGVFSLSFGLMLDSLSG